MSLFAVITIQAQCIIGEVTTSNKLPVEAATVRILNTDKVTITDKHGHFKIANINIGTYKLHISSIGYATQIRHIEIIKGDRAKIKIVLSDIGKQLDEVVVSSDKTESDLQKTPIAVTALNAKELEAYRVWNFADLTALAPSAYTVEHGNSAGSNFLNFRGAMGFTNEQAVATYVDGVYQFDFYSAPLNFNNIERVEILRGPQGTLYGRNAFGGVLNIITKRPTNTSSGFASADFGNYGQQRYSMGFNTPLINNKLFMDAGLQFNHRGAVYSNPTLHDKQFDGHNAYSGNLNLKYTLSEKWNLSLNTRYENDKDKGAYPWSATDSAARSTPYQVFGNWDNTERRTNFNTSLVLNYYGRNFNFTAITGFIAYHIWFPNRFDADFTADSLISGHNWTKSNQITQEFRFSSPANSSRLQWTIGTFLFGEKTKNNNTTFFEKEYTKFDPDAPFTTISAGKIRNFGAAIFGQGTYTLFPKFKLTLGTRYDMERRELTQNFTIEKNKVITVLSPDSTANKKFTAFTPKVILSYDINNNSMLYTSYAKGFRLGGFNFGSSLYPTYKPENSDNYEVGIKNNLLNNKLKLNITGFYFQQKGQQVSTTQDGVNYAIQNVGDMNNLGLELETSALPIKNLRIDWTASTSHSEYRKLKLYDPITGAVVNYKSNKAIYTPAVQSMFAAQYNIHLSRTSPEFEAFIRGEFKYIGEYELNFDNSDHQNGYGLINARAGIASNHLDIAVWARNLNDVRYLAFGYGSYMLGSPRMWGITFTGKF